MRGDKPPLASKHSSQDRRRFPRLSLYADATLVNRQGLSLPCKIRDFCLTGMAITWPEQGKDVTALGSLFNKGDIVTIGFSCQVSPGEKSYKIDASIARSLTDGLGLAFASPDPQALQALRTLAEDFERTQVVANFPAGDDKFVDDGQRIDLAGLLPRLRGLCERHLKHQYTIFNGQVEQLLFRQAKNAKSNSESTSVLDAIPAVTKRREQIAGAATARILQAIESPGINATPQRPEATPKPNLEGTLSLLGKDEFEDLLALADIISRAEQRYKTKLFELEQRFSQIYRRTIDRANDPLAPTALCNAFANSLQEVGLSETQRRAAYYAFQDAIIPLLGTLYDDVNQLLIDSGVLPSLRPAVKRAPVSSTVGSVGAKASTPMSQTVPGSPPSQESRGTRQSMSLAEEFAEMSQDLAFSAAQTLMGLNRLMSTQNLSSAATTGTLSRLGMGGRSGANTSFSRDELLNALVSLRDQTYVPAAAAPMNVKDQLLSVLQNSNGQGTAGRSLGQGDSDALDLVNNMITAMFQDPRVNDPFREEINKLQIPLHLLALQDPAFFSDKNHPARQFINRAAQLYSSSSGAIAPPLQSVIDRLFSDIGSTPNISSQLFTPALTELDRLVEQQARAYSENVTKLIAECDEHQEVLRSKRKQTKDNPASSEPLMPAGMPPELANEFRLWMERAQRLRVPDTVRFDQGDGKFQQLRVAWIGEDYSSIVFADELGRKVNSTTLQELAMLLRRGKANVVEHSDLAAVDRALHTVLYQMHERIERQALSDSITGLANKRRFMQRLDSAVQSAIRDNVTHAVALLAVHGHKPLVEGFGTGPLHKLLQKFAELISTAVGANTTVARLDDCVFAVLLEHGSPNTLEALLAPCIQQIEKTRVKMHEQLFSLTATLRSALIDGSAGDSDELLAALEHQVLLERSSAPDDDLQIQTVQVAPLPTVDWPAQLRTMLGQEQLELYCRPAESLQVGVEQPLYLRIEIGTRSVEEELVLLRHTMLPAEMNEDLVRVDLLLVKNALAWCASHREEFDTAGGCAMRLHAPTLKNTQTIDHILEQLIESGLPTGRICFEISETDAAHCLLETERLIRTLSEFGCTFCISAYGRGELQHADLERLNVNSLMIDPRMTKGVERSNSDYAVVKSTTEIARLLGKRVLAEQVQSHEARNKLAEIGLDYVELEYTPAKRLDERM